MMKKEVPLSKTSRLINSGQVILVSSAYQDQRNIVTLAWHMPFSHQPPLVGIAVAKKHFTAALIRQGQEFVINIPEISLLEKVIYCGSHSGREGDKFQATGLTPKPAERLKKTPQILECVGHIECRLKETLEQGDHNIFIGEPLYACAQEDLFADVWLVDKVKLIFHLGGKNFTTSAESISQ